jgi:predicted acetyltransferase
MAAPPTVREAREADMDAVFAATDIAFHRGETPLMRARRTTDPNPPRAYVAEADGAVVGTTGVWDWRVSVPGGELPCAAVTIVTVLPTHRRRGILRSMMARTVEDARAGGAPLAGLWASEGGIYGRFGYGPATWQRDGVVDLRRGPVLRAPVPEPLDVRLLRPADAGPVVASIFARARARRGGMMDRTDSWWERRILADEPDDRGGASGLRIVVAADDGYALYRVREGAPTGPVSAQTTVECQELVAATAEAERTLLTFLSRIDLADELVLAARPVDDPLWAATEDARSVRPQEQHDALWLRILDLPAAVAGRSWAADADLVLDVVHPEDEHVAGTWALRVGPSGAACERTDRPADLRLHARELGCVYLGGRTVAALRDAGLVEERTDGACARLDAALRVERAPWTTGVF